MVDAQCDQPFNVSVAFDTIKGLVKEATAKLVEGLESVIETQKNDACGGLQEHLDASKKQGLCLSHAIRR